MLSLYFFFFPSEFPPVQPALHGGIIALFHNAENPADSPGFIELTQLDVVIFWIQRMEVIALVLLDETIAVDHEQADLADFHIRRTLDIYVLAITGSRFHRRAIDGDDFIGAVGHPCVSDQHRFT